MTIKLFTSGVLGYELMVEELARTRSVQRWTLARLWHQSLGDVRVDWLELCESPSPLAETTDFLKYVLDNCPTGDELVVTGYEYGLGFVPLKPAHRDAMRTHVELLEQVSRRAAEHRIYVLGGRWLTAERP